MYVVRYLAKGLLAVHVIFNTTSCSTTTTQNMSETQKSPTASSSPAAAASIQQGNQYARDGLLREAVDAYKIALTKEPANLVAHRNLGIVLVKAGDYSGAASHLEKSLAGFSDNFDTNFYLAEAYRALDNYGEAIFRYKSALKIQKEEPRALKSLSWCYYKTHYYTEALNIAQRMQITHPADDQIPVIIARIYLRLKRENEALNIIRKAMAQTKAASRPYYQSVEAEILQAKGSTNEALAVYKQALKQQPMLAGALLGSGRILLEQGKTAEAVDSLERAVRIKPKLFEGHYYLGKALEASNPQKALRYFAHFRKNAAADPELLDLVQDAKRRIGSLSKSGQKIDALGN